jgi:hypothetical protein
VVPQACWAIEPGSGRNVQSCHQGDTGIGKGSRKGKKFEEDGPAPIFGNRSRLARHPQTGLSSKHPELAKRFITKECFPLLFPLHITQGLNFFGIFRRRGRRAARSLVSTSSIPLLNVPPRPTCDTYLKSDKNRSRLWPKLSDFRRSGPRRVGEHGPYCSSGTSKNRADQPRSNQGAFMSASRTPTLKPHVRMSADHTF